MRVFFDNKTLEQYIDTKTKLKVFVDGQWVTIADREDVSDKVNGVGQDNEGNAIIFDYRDIQQVKAGNNQITLDQLQKQAGGEKEKPASASKKNVKPEAEEEPEEEPGSGMPGMPEEEPGEAGGGMPEMPEEEPGGGGEPEEPEEEPEDRTAQTASYDPFMLGKRIMNELYSKKSAKKGSIVEIVDRKNDYYGCKATIIEDYGNEYNVRILDWRRNDVVTVYKNQIKFL